MVQAAIREKITDLDKLASWVFYMHHPERHGKPIEAGEHNMITQWKGFRAMIAPLIDYKPKPTPPKPPETARSRTPNSNPS